MTIDIGHEGWLAVGSFSNVLGTPMKWFLIALATIALSAACIENGLHPAMLGVVPLIGAALARKEHLRPFFVSEKTLTILFVLYTAVVAFLLHFLHGTIFIPLFIVYFTAGALVIRAFTPLTRRNTAQFIFLTAGIILINCILTNHLVFGLVLPLYLFLLMCTLAIFQISGIASTPRVPHERPPFLPRRLLLFFTGASGVLLLFTVIAFVVLPRPFFVFPGLKAATSRPGGLADLEPRITYRDMLDMSGRQRIAFTVRVEWGTLPDFPYWRGRVLERTDGFTWFQAKEKGEVRKFIEPDEHDGLLYTITPFKLQSPHVYACCSPLYARGRFGRPLYISARGEVIVDSPFLVSDSYSVSSVKQPLPSSPRQEAFNLDSTGVTPRIKRLAEEWTAQAQSAAEKARAIVSRLETDYRYRLDVPPPPENSSPFEYFLFRTRAGHCEYFAGSLCLLLRAVGIPARVVEGFAGVEPTETPNEFIVRFSSAHAWVEATLGDRQWTVLDPAPPVLEQGQTPLWRVLLDLYDRTEQRWIKYVIYFDRHDQVQLMEFVSGIFSQETITRAVRVIGLRMLFVVGLVGIVVTAVFGLLIRSRKREIVNLSGTYVRTMEALVRKGLLSTVHPWHERNLDELSKVAPHLREAAELFTRLYLCTRFGTERLPQPHELEHARKALLKAAASSPQGE